MIYPTASPDVFPVFAAEWVVFGDRVHALILDVEVCGEQPALVSDLSAEFASLGNAWREQFPENRERPDWFQSIAMPWVLYGCCEADRIPGIRRAFNEYLRVRCVIFIVHALRTRLPARMHLKWRPTNTITM